MWCSLHVTSGDHDNNVRAPQAYFSYNCAQTCEFLKNTRVELQNTRMLPTRVLKSLNRAVPQLFAYVTVRNLAKITY